MRNEDMFWTRDQEAEIAVLHAAVIVMALRARVDARAFDRIPSLGDFVAMAGTVAKEMGWEDEIVEEI